MGSRYLWGMLAASSNSRARILLLIPHLGGGGAEQVTLLLAENLSPQRYEVHLVAVTQGMRLERRHLPNATHIEELNAGRVRKAIIPLLRTIWRLRPQLILSNMAHLNFLVLLLRPLFPPRTRVLVRQNGMVSAMLAQANVPPLTRTFYRHLYHRADRIICQSGAMVRDLAEISPSAKESMVVLANPVDVEGLRRQVKCARNHWIGPGPHLLAVGRLAAEKGFDLLLEALAILSRRQRTADLVIAGAGPTEAALKELCRTLELDSLVCFLGSVPAPVDYCVGATLFVVASRHEGLPNALLEAAAVGLPIVATPASGGMTEFLEGQPGIWLADSISASALAAALEKALGELEVGKRFPHRWLDDFRLERAIPAYEQLIDAMLRRAR
jgi:glycosyltransferase involved in cell wall biosynthesis